MHGTSFVVSRITSLVQLIVYSDKLSFELDPSKLLEGQTLEANRESLSGAASLVLDHITDSDVPIPASVAYVFRRARALMAPVARCLTLAPPGCFALRSAEWHNAIRRTAWCQWWARSGC